MQHVVSVTCYHSRNGLGTIRCTASPHDYHYAWYLVGASAGCEANAMTGYEDLYETEWSGILGFTQVGVDTCACL